MTVQELKQYITENTLSDDLMVWVCPEDNFIASQYIEAICSNRGFIRHNINSIFDVLRGPDCFSFREEKDLNVLIVDTFAERADDYSLFTNTIVVCKKIDKKIKSIVEPYVTELPKLQEWQVKDYIKVKCPQLTQTDIDWLYKNTSGNTFRIDNELDKVNLFHPNYRRSVLIAIKDEEGSDLYVCPIYTLVDALITKNKLDLMSILQHRDCCDLEPVGLVKLLLDKYKNIALIAQDSGATAEQLGLTPKVFNAIRYYYKNIPVEVLLDKISFLSSIDMKLKLGQLDISNKAVFLDYLICKIAQ